MKQGKRMLVSLIAALVVGAVYFYLALPAINLQDMDFYIWVGVMCLVYLITWLSKGSREERGEQKVIFVDGNAVRIDPTGFAPGTFKSLPAKLPLIIVGLMAVVIVVGSLISWKGFRAQDYYDLLPVTTGDFTEDVAEISYNEIPMLDEASAQQLGRLIDRFLENIKSDNRVIFLRRYWFGDSVKDIARQMGMTQNAVSVRLNRTREQLRAYLQKEGY